MPPLYADEQAHKRLMAAGFKKLTAEMHQINLDNAVLLAQQAARRGGELADHFAELGRRFHHLLQAPPPGKPRLRLVKGGAA